MTRRDAGPRWTAATAVAVLALAATGSPMATEGAAPAFRATHTDAGLAVTLEVRAARGGDAPVGTEAIRAGEPALVALSFAAAPAGTPARGLRPAAWAERAVVGMGQDCRARVQRLLQPRLGQRPEVDFNAWQLAFVGDNGGLYVLDPVGGNARTRLLAVVNLGARVAGLAADPARDTLYFALPDRAEVVEVDALRWAERRRIAVTGRPGRLALDTDGVHLWVGQDGAPGAATDLVAIARAEGAVVARLAAGPGPHVLSGTRPGSVVAGSPAGAVLADVQAGTVQALPGLGGGFADAAYSPLAELALLLDRAEGRVLALRHDGHPVASWAVAPGATGLFLEPSGRLLLVPEPEERRVTVIDLGRGVVAHRVALDDLAPLRIGFSRGQAFVQSAEGTRVALIALASLVEGGEPTVATIAGGETGLGLDEALGATVARAPGDGAMLIAAPSERAVHVYMEGMVAPSGSLRTVQARPLAIIPVDRGLRETEPGRYETSAVFPAAGRYVLPVMQQGGGFLHCFEFEVAPEATAAAIPLSARLAIALEQPADRIVAASLAAPLRLRLSGPADDGRWREARDVVARLVQVAGHWQSVTPMRALGGGVYEIAAAVAPPRAGLVNLYVESASLGLRPETLPYITLRATAP